LIDSPSILFLIGVHCASRTFSFLVLGLFPSALDKVISKLILHLILSIPEAFLHHLLYFCWGATVNAFFLESLGVFDIVNHGTHGKARCQMTIGAMAIEDSIKLVLSITDAEEAVLIHGILLAFPAAEFYVPLGEEFLVVTLEVLKNVLSVQNRL